MAWEQKDLDDLNVYELIQRVRLFIIVRSLHNL